MRRAPFALIVVCMVTVACSKAKKPEEWKERTGPGFTVMAPSDARHMTKPIAAGVEMQVYEYRDGISASLQVDVAEAPDDRSPTWMVVTVRDNFAAKAKVTREDDVPMGDTPGKDLVGTSELAPYGKVRMRTRIVVQGRKLYQLMTIHPVGKPELDADADRFVESFKLTEPSQDPLARLEATTPGMKVKRGVGSADETGWYAARSVNGKFSVQAPNVLNEVETDIDLGKMYMVATQTLPERIKFTAVCVVSDKPQGRDEFIAKLGAVDARRDRELQGRPAIEVESEGNRSALAVFDNHRLCMLTVEPVSKTTPRPTADVRRFFDSFALED